MESRSLKRRLEDDEPLWTKLAKVVQHDATEDVNEELPKILSSEVLDVLPIFANMLDVRSFTRLAMTCKDMHKRCNEDKRIKINVSDQRLEVITGRGDPNFTWKLKKRIERRDQYLAKISQPPCVLALKSLYFSDILTATTGLSVRAACDHLREMKVASINEIVIGGKFLAWTELFLIIGEFHVKRLRFYLLNAAPDDTLLSLLRLDLDFFGYGNPVPINVLLQARSPIPKIELDKVANITDDSFMQLLWLIQTGALHRLTIKKDSVNLSRDQTLPYAFDGLLPDNRPLVFHRNDDRDECWFLHWNGGVTMGVCYGDKIELFTSERDKYPPVLKNEEEALDDLNKQMMNAAGHKPAYGGEGGSLGMTISCSSPQFRSFFSRFPMIEASHEGPLPTERPLFFKISEERFHLVNEHDILLKYKWKDGYSTVKTKDYIYLDRPSFNHPSLEKFIIRKCLQRNFVCHWIIMSKVEKKVFNGWFEGFKILPMEYDGPLPEERPLVFERDDSSLVLLNENNFFYKCALVDNSAKIVECPPNDIPPFLFKKKHVADIVSLWDNGQRQKEKIDIHVTLETFRNGFEKFKTIPMDYEGPLPDERPMVLVKTQEATDQRLVIFNNCIVNCEWKNGHAVFSNADPRELTMSVTQLLLHHLLETKFDSNVFLKLCMKLETIEKCLSSYKTLPFYYYGPVPKDGLVVFTKTEVKESCPHREQAGDWPETMMTIWMLKDGTQLSYATWGEKEPLEFVFRGNMYADFVPPALKTKEYLKWLILEAQFKEKETHARFTFWHGDFDDFLALVGEFTELPYFFNGDLPEERPLVFEEEDEGIWLIYRDDGRLIHCYNIGDRSGIGFCDFLSFSTMDSRSLKRRLEDDEPLWTKLAKVVQHDATEDVNEELPKILSSEVLDVLPIFANMLDVRSFTRLAMTCKDMHKRCNEDKGIKINVNENGLEVITGRGDPNFAWHLEKEKKNREKYLASVRRSGVLTLKSLSFTDIQTATSADSVRTACTYLRDMNVKNICELRIIGNFLPWEMVNSVVEEFHVKRLEIVTRHPLSADTLLSLLSLNLEFFRFHDSVPIDVLLQMTSTIPKIELRDMEDISGDHFMEILGLVQQGVLPNLIINSGAVHLDPVLALPYDLDGPIPHDRPLSFHRKHSYIDEYWFLNWQGNVFKCVADHETLNLTKCGKSDYPPALKNEVEAVQHLNEQRERLICWRPSQNEKRRNIFNKKMWRISCSLFHFHSFFTKLPLLEASHDGPLPAERPLYCTCSEDRFWLLNEHDILMECKWNDGYAEWTAVEYFRRKYPSFNHPSLEKFMIRKGFETSFGIGYGFDVTGIRKDVLNSVLEDFETLPMNYDGPLPDERPLVFEEQNARVVLAKDGFVYKCHLYDVYARISECALIELPPILVEGKHVQKFLELEEIYSLEKFDIRVTLETFRKGLDKFKTIPMDYEDPLPEERPLALVKTQENDGEVVVQCLVIHVNTVVKSEWMNGHAVFSQADPREFPLTFTESLFHHLLKKKSENFEKLTLIMKLETIEKALAAFKVQPFDYDGPLPEDDVVIFTKTEVKSGCRLREQAGDWPEKMMTIWMLKEGKDLKVATWGAEEPMTLEFRGYDDPEEVPPALKTKEYLKRLLLMCDHEEINQQCYQRITIWYGGMEDFHACLNEFHWMRSYYDVELPEGRPLVFDIVDDEFGGELWGVLREDGRLICCYNNGSGITISGDSAAMCPPAIRHLAS